MAGVVQHIQDPDCDRTELRALLETRGWSLGEAARRIGVSESTVSLWLREVYRGDNARIGRLVRRWLDTERDVSALRTAGLDRHADLAVTERIERALRHAQANADCVVIYGAAGAGKTWALRRYCGEAAGGVVHGDVAGDHDAGGGAHAHRAGAGHRRGVDDGGAPRAGGGRPARRGVDTAGRRRGASPEPGAAGRGALRARRGGVRAGVRRERAAVGASSPGASGRPSSCRGWG